ncbi:MAG: 3-methyladenine DNA glycosylase [Campylobacterales bacterium]|nr:3-methyladenine DNA glycosylase [Campylobacterales bacterium]
MQSSCDLLYALKKLNYLEAARDFLWWPNSGTFEVIVGAILTQQTRWEKVEESLVNLKQENILSLVELSNRDLYQITRCIKPSGFYNTKAHRLQALCKNIIKDFGSFDNFQKNVSREWLLAQKGIGMESADSILCYGCKRDIFVVDSYTKRLLDAFGYTFDDYTQLQEWMQNGIKENLKKVKELYCEDLDPSAIYARFHGKIVEYAKEHIRGKTVDIKPLLELI